MQLLAKQTRTAAQLHIFEYAIRIGFPVVLRTDGRTESDVITKTKTSCIDELPNSLTNGAPRAHHRSSIELKKNILSVLIVKQPRSQGLSSSCPFSCSRGRERKFSLIFTLKLYCFQ